MSIWNGFTFEWTESHLLNKKQSLNNIEYTNMNSDNNSTTIIDKFVVENNNSSSQSNSSSLSSSSYFEANKTREQEEINNKNSIYHILKAEEEEEEEEMSQNESTTSRTFADEDLFMASVNLFESFRVANFTASLNNSSSCSNSNNSNDSTIVSISTPIRMQQEILRPIVEQKTPADHYYDDSTTTVLEKFDRYNRRFDSQLINGSNNSLFELFGALSENAG